MLNPVFSVGNMRALLPTVQHLADTMLELFSDIVPTDGSESVGLLQYNVGLTKKSATAEVDVLPWAGRGTLEMVGRAILGIDMNILDGTSTNEHAENLRSVGFVHYRLMNRIVVLTFL